MALKPYQFLMVNVLRCVHERGKEACCLYSGCTLCIQAAHTDA